MTLFLIVSTNELLYNIVYSSLKKINVGVFKMDCKNQCVFFNLAGDSLFNHHNGHAFSTKYRDNDANRNKNCANLYLGGWWYNSCYDSNLNGKYYNEAGRADWTGIVWYHWKAIRNYTLKRVSMKIRPNK